MVAKLRFMCLEDNEDHALIITEALKDAFGPATEIAVHQTLSSCLVDLAPTEKGSSFDIVFCDLNVLDSRGLNTLQKLLEVFPKTPIIVLSALENEDLAVQALSEGAQDYICKAEIDPKTVLRKTKYALERQAILNELSDAKAKLAAQADFKSRFLAQMSHEIRTPLNSMLGHVSVLMRSELSLDQQDILDSIHSNGESLIAIINDILDISKFEAGEVTLHPEYFEIRKMLEDVVSSLASIANQKLLPVLTVIDKSVPLKIQLDSNRLRQVLGNLLSNAIKYTKQGFVCIRVGFHFDAGRTTQGCLRIEVSDTGRGIPAKEMDELFIPFKQLQNSDQTMGTGLGLAIAANLVKLMGGAINVKSEAGQGSHFWFEVSCCTENGKSFRPRPDFQSKKTVILSEADSFAKIIDQQLVARGLQTAEIMPPNSVVKLSASNCDLLIVDAHNWKSNSHKLFWRHYKQNSLAEVPTLLIVGEDATTTLAKVGDETSRAVSPFPLLHSKLLEACAQVLDLEELQRSRSQASMLQPATFDDKKYSGKVLVVDDVAGNLKVTARILEILGCQFELCEDGAAAIAKCKNTRYDLVLMDCYMAGLSGFETTAAIKNSAGPNAKTPIVALTADALPEARKECIDAGMVDILIKPIRVEDISRVLKRFLPNQEGEPGAALLDGKILASLCALDPPGENGTFLRQIFETFQNDSVEILSRLEGVLAEKNRPKIKSVAHKLKGFSRNLGATQLAQACNEMETESTDADSAKLKELYAKIAKLHGVTIKHLQNYLDSLGSRHTRPRAG